MAAYAQFGYGGYPSASQLLSSSAAQSQSPQSGDTPTAQSTISAANAPALSPAAGLECRTNVAVGDVSTGALSPDAISQNSNAAGAGVAALTNVPVGVEAAALSAHHGVAASGGSCCENGRPIMTDPVSGQTVCSCQYDSARLALSSYSRLPAASVGVYGTPYPSTDQNPYQSIGVDSSAFYTPLSNPYTLKDSTTGSEMTAWTSAGLQPTTGYYSYDPMTAYGYGASYDLAARRKNATRESTATLKAWLNEHKKNPYPTKGEKIMLAIITKMTLTQVSTWFANARRRLKKENKMTWEPKNRTDDDDDAVVSDDEKDKDESEHDKTPQGSAMHAGNTGMSGGAGIVGTMGGGIIGMDQRKDSEKDDDELVEEDQKPLHHSDDMRGDAGVGFSGAGGYHSGNHPHSYHPYHHQHPAYYQHQQAMLAASYHSSNSINKNEHSDPKNQQSRDCGVPIPATKPKIWSLADTVACKTPPPAAYMGQQHLQQQHMSGNSISMQQQQQQQQLTPQMQQQQQQPPQHMMSNFGGMPYSRMPTTAYGGFLGATAQQPHTTNNIRYNSNNNGSSSSSSNNGTHTPTTPTMVNPLAQLQQQQQQLPLRHAANQRGMGFPEAQPDTPPQTPPNMKVPSMAANLLLTASQAPTTATYRSTNSCYGSAGSQYASRFNAYSPRDESSSGSSCSGGGSPLQLQHEANFKPLFKSQQLSVAGFVPPV